MSLALFDDPAGVEAAGPDAVVFDPRADPVLATTTAAEPTAFVRVMLLPVEHAGRRTIRHVDPADAGRPGSRATSFLEQPVRA